ncbi:MAG: dTDP-4-dehydrorhamnose reductase [Acidobacteria bacterium]|nr:dTDP-4-dehydrorhamnose reductase [Acidobacteriota bacterium]
MKILITGANGMVARAAIKHCHALGDDVAAFTRSELDITNRDAVFDTLVSVRPDAVINCAAFTDVDGAEEKREICFAVNASGAENLALASKEIDRPFLTISTDYVFGGDKSGFYDQRDTPDPIGYYGATKYDGEILARKAYARSIVVRSGWIFGNGGTNFLSTMHSFLEKGNTIKAIYDAFGTPTYADDLVVRLRQLIGLDLPLIFHVKNSGDLASFSDFAEEICRINGLNTDLVEKIPGSVLNRPAKRPRNSGLECLFSERLGLKPLRDWKDALASYLSAA